MTYKKYQSANNAICELEVAISNTDMSLKATWPYNRFKTENFIIKVTERDVDGKIIARENMYVVSRTGDTFTIGERAYEAVPIDDDATTNTKTALEFNAWAVVEMVISEEVIKDIQEEIERLEDDKADDDEVVHLTGNETIAWEKTFLVAPKAPTPTEDDDLTTKEYVDDNITDASSPSALYEKWLLAGEDIDANDSVFVEDMVTFASANQVQAIGDTAANTRVSIIAFGSGVASNTLKLALRKYISPWVDLWVRIETDNAGEPSGTLFDADATATVTAASLTTSLVDTTVTLADTITIPKGEKVHIVLFAGTYGSETINGTNYFGVGYSSKISTTRKYVLYDGADWWNPTIGADTTDTQPMTYSQNSSWVSWLGFRFTTKYDLYVKKVIKVSTLSWWSLRAMIRDLDTWTILASTTNLVWDTFTFASPYYIPANTTVRVEIDNSWSTYTRKYNSNFFGFSWVNIDSSSLRWSQNWTNSNYAWNVMSVVTYTIDRPAEEMMYITSDLFTPKLLSLTDATYSYKLPTDLPRVLTESKMAGQNAIATTLGLHDNFSGLTPLADYYLADTPWAISSTPWTNEYWVGRSISDTILNIWWEVPPKFNTNFTSINVSVWNWWNTTTSAYRPIRDEFVTITLQASATWSNVRLEISSDGSSWSTLYEAPTWSSHNRNVLLKKWMYYRSHAEASSPWSWSITVLWNASISIWPNQYPL